MQIAPGVVLGSGMVLGVGSAPTGNMILQYVMGNSASFNGQGIDLQHNDFLNSPPPANTNLIFDTSADYANGAYGNTGVYVTNEGSGNITGSDFVNHGSLSYVTFDGGLNNQYLDSETINGYNIPAGSSYTIFAVVRMKGFDPGSGNGGGIVGGDHMYFEFVPQNIFGNYPFLCANNTNDFPVVLDNTTPYQYNTWYAVALTYDSVSQTMKLYTNGQLVSSATGVAPIGSNEPLYWGTIGGNNYLNGDLAVMTVWDYALSAGEITSYTNQYGNPYGVNSKRQDNDMPVQSYSQLFSVPGEYTFQVPQGVSSVSMVAVGAGGGGTWGGFSPPGGDSYVYSQWAHFNIDMTTNAGYSDAPFITFDCTGGNNAALLGNVAPGWLITSADFNNDYPNKALIQGNVYGMVTAVDSTDTANVVLTISPTVTSTNGGTYHFLGQTIVGAQGAPQITDSRYYTNQDGTPGPRALPLWGDSGGKGGVVDALDSWPIGGAGAGGYGTNDVVVAFDPTQTFVYDSNGNTNTGEANIVLGLSDYNLSVEATANNASYPGIATGTYEIDTGQKVMFSLTMTTAAPSGNQGIGFGNYGANLQSYVGSDVNGGAFYNDGSFVTNGAQAYTGYPTFTTGDVVDIAIDNSNVLNQLTWVRVNGGDWMGDPGADPSTDTNGVPFTISVPLYLMTTQGDQNGIGKWTINESNAHPIPSGYTFIAGSPNVGSNGGTGASEALPTNTDGQGDGNIGGSGAGGGGIYDDIGSGGGGVGLYGVGNPGTRGGWVDNDTYSGNSPYSEWQAQAVGGRGGSRRGNSGTQGGMASSWAGGAGGWPGGGGGSGTSLWDGGNGGALAYKNNVSVNPGSPGNAGQQLQVIVGQGGWGGGVSNVTYYTGGVGGGGAVRIMWPGDTRAFPAFNAGIDPLVTSFTINPGDFGSGGPYNSISQSSGTIGNNYTQIYPTSEQVAQNVFAFFRSIGVYTQNPENNNAPYDVNNFNAYIFDVTWGDGSTIPNGLVRMSYSATYGSLFISTVDPTNTAYETANPSNVDPGGTTVPGTFNFPATFTLRTPTIQSGGLYWC